MNKGEAWLTLGIVAIVGYVLFKAAGLFTDALSKLNPFSNPAAQTQTQIQQQIQAMQARGMSQTQIIDAAIQNLRQQGYTWDQLQNLLYLGSQFLFGSSDVALIQQRLAVAQAAEQAGGAAATATTFASFAATDATVTQ